MDEQNSVKNLKALKKMLEGNRNSNNTITLSKETSVLLIDTLATTIQTLNAAIKTMEEICIAKIKEDDAK